MSELDTIGERRIMQLKCSGPTAQFHTPLRIESRLTCTDHRKGAGVMLLRMKGVVQKSE